MPAPDYEKNAGTVIGEIRNEIFTKYGLAAYENAKYGWHHAHPSETIVKSYNLVSGSTVQFLLATTTYGYLPPPPRPTGSYYYEVEISGSIVSMTGSYDDMPTASLTPIVDIHNPIQLEFFWYDANIPFLDKDVVDAQGLTYELK